MIAGKAAAIYRPGRFASVDAYSSGGKVGSQRREVEARWRETQQHQVNTIFRKYDTNDSGALEREQLWALMVDLNKSLGVEAEAVQQEEVDGLMQKCDLARNGAINRDEVLRAVEEWRKHMDVLAQIQPLLVKYHLLESEQLDKDQLEKNLVIKDQLKNLLVDLNDGIEIESGDVPWVIDNAEKLGNGRVGKMEIMRAISLWYFHIEDQAVARQAGINSTCCCTQ